MWLATLLVVLCTCYGVSAGDSCYPSGAVAGIVVATIVVTCVVGMLTAVAVWKYWWTPRKKKAQEITEQQKHQQRHQPQKASSDFAFDNPYFRNQEGDDVQGKGKSSLNKNSLRSSKQSDNSGKAKKGRGGKNHFGFGGGAGGAGKKQKALDDTCVAQVERTFVNLRGHDFTGLGFNICGNMRDGILVKDVLHRGPASESGLIKAGDKIVNVTVSFTNIVYEDALTILSYASPYDVQLEIERIPDHKSRTTPSGGKKLQLGSCSFTSSGQKLFHPLYRSQSIDDLTQIDGSLPGPRRSQSVGVAAHKVLASSHFRDKEERSPMSLVLSTTGSLNEKMLANVMGDNSKTSGGLQWEKKFEDTLESDGSTTPQASSKSKNKVANQVQGSKATTETKTSDQTQQNSKQRDSRQYLDYPHTKLNLEARMILDDSDIQSFSKTPASNTDVKVEPNEVNSRTRMVRKEEENDSDVSRDSLEVNHRGYHQKKKKAPTVEGERHQIKTDNLGAHTDVPSKNSRSERVYANTSKTTRIHTSSLSSNDEIEPQSAERSKTSYQKDTSGESSVYGHLREVAKQPQQTAYRSTQQKPLPYGQKHNTSSEGQQMQSYGSSSSIEAQTPKYGRNTILETSTQNYGRGSSNVESQLQNYGRSSNRIVINAISNEDSGVTLTPSGYTSQRQQSDTLEQENNKPQQKFTKKPLNPAGGMFTQINPFQHPSKQKHSGFKPRVYRKESNGDFPSRHCLSDNVKTSSSHPSTVVHSSSHGINYKQH